MRCIVVDDEPLARQGMELLINQVPDLEHKGSFSSVIDADTYLRENHVDIIFLDIQMPGISGFEYLKIHNPIAKVVITTAYPQYALESYEYNIVDYLTKPVRLERFFKAVKKCELLNEKKEGTELISYEEGYFFIRANKRYTRINIDDVVFIEGQKDYSKIVCSKTHYLVAFNLKTLESNLKSSCFVRVNKSYIVNRNFVQSFDANFVYLEKAHIPIGESFKDDLIEKLTNSRILKKV